ncbi:hypothetical protein [Fusobacterium sp. PH5-44]|uniref:hypothetical protein n=1 Tax=unclassified Fusobacterium TaxID=2648384 RepID=UPI003D1ED5EB
MNYEIIPENAIELRIRLNDKLTQEQMLEIYGEPFEYFLKSHGYGKVFDYEMRTDENNELEFYIIKFYCYKTHVYNNAIGNIMEYLEELGTPQGSKFDVPMIKSTLKLGIKEGLGVYIDNKNLSKEVCEPTDINYIYKKIKELVQDDFKYERSLVMKQETALYFYSNISFEQMRENIREFIDSYPLFENARIIKIA